MPPEPPEPPAHLLLFYEPLCDDPILPRGYLSPWECVLVEMDLRQPKPFAEAASTLVEAMLAVLQPLAQRLEDGASMY